MDDETGSLATVERLLPCVVHVGFAGARKLFPDDAGGDVAPLEADVARYLADRLGQLTGELGLESRHFLCGVSQVAIGADMQFTRACQQCAIPQRVLLPQPASVYLCAAGSAGPDFSPCQRDEATRLLEGEHVIQVQVVSVAEERRERFEETNQEILRLSDVVVCVLPENASGRPGGTIDLLEAAKGLLRPTLEIRVSLTDDGRAAFREQWHFRNARATQHVLGQQIPAEFPPQLPQELQSVRVDLDVSSTLPDCGRLCQALIDQGDRRAGALRKWSTLATLLRLVFPMSAAICAAWGAAAAARPGAATVTAIQLALLLATLALDLLLRHASAPGRWAVSRLAAETGRSLAALQDRLAPPAWSRVGMPERFTPLLRTLEVLHLRSLCSGPLPDWRTHRAAYLHSRITSEATGQLAYYAKHLQRDRGVLKKCLRAFVAATLLAIAFTAIKLKYALAAGPDSSPLSVTVLSTLLPALAAVTIAWPSAQDLFSRVSSYDEMQRFLRLQQHRLACCNSPYAYDHLLLETESRLLNETAQWYTRRADRDL